MEILFCFCCLSLNVFKLLTFCMLYLFVQTNFLLDKLLKKENLFAQLERASSI